MRDLALVVGAAALALAVVAGVVFGGHDTTVLVSPPENVAEDFTRKLATGRYDVALAHLEQNDSSMLPVVRTSGENLRTKAGAVDHVDGDYSAIEGETARARVIIETERAGELRWYFRLVRREGVWKIAEWN